MNEEPIIIGIQGLAGSGKDTLAKMLMDNAGNHIVPHRIAFADALKRTAAELYGVNLKVFHDREHKEIKLDTCLTEDRISPREILQHFGTDVLRHADEDIWVKRMFGEIADVVHHFSRYKGMVAMMIESKPLSEYNYTEDFFHKLANDGEYKKNLDKDVMINLVVIPDVRFENEQEFVKENGGILIEVRRKNLDVGEMDFTHASETSIDTSIIPDFVIDNSGSLSNLYVRSVSILNTLGLR